MRGLLLGAVIGLVCTSVAIAQRSGASQDDAAMMEQFAGTWRLVSLTTRFKDGTTRDYPNVAGYIIYTDTGHMCAVLMNRDRPKWKAETAPTAEETKSSLVAPTDFSSYCGTTEINAKEGFVLHNIELDKSPNSVGTTRKRWFTLKGNRLTLRVDPREITSPGVVDSTLVYERKTK